jgi:hypothetical protein
VQNPESDKLLQKVAVSSCAAVFKFVAYDHFEVDTRREARVQICSMAADFGTRFVCTTENNIEAASLTAHSLLRAAPCTDVLAELGDRAEVPLAHVWELLSRQPHGGKDTIMTREMLLVDEITFNTNVFFGRDKNGDLWAIFLDWKSFYKGWNIGARRVEDPYPLREGSRIFSR